MVNMVICVLTQYVYNVFGIVSQNNMGVNFDSQRLV